MKREILYVGTRWADQIATSLETSCQHAIVHTVSDAVTARSELEATDFDCIVVEYELPDETGTRFLSALADGSDYPTILLASEDAEPPTADAVSANPTDYFLIEQFDDQYGSLVESIQNAVEQEPERSRHQAALEAADIGAWEYDIATETLWLSDRVREIHGIPQDTAVTVDDIVERYSAEDRQAVRDTFDRAISEVESLDKTVRLDSDDERWVRIRSQPETQDGTICCLRGSCQDITDLKQREEQFKCLHTAGRELMQATSPQEAAQITINAAKDILGYAKGAFRLVDENEEVLRVFATTKDNVAVAGERPDYRIEEDVPAARTYRNGQPKVFSDLNATRDEYERGALRSGLYVPVGNHGVFSCGSLEPNAYDETDVDVVEVLTKLTATALTRIEADRELRQKKDQLDSFTSIVAHDLRNPLNVASSRLELARHDPQDTHFAKMDSQLERMESIISDLLTLARAGEPIDELSDVSLSDVADEARKHAQTEGLDVTVADDVTIKADHERLLHILENLFRNAIDHNEPPVSLTVGKLDESRATGGPSITGFFIEDDGSGIPPENRKDVFDHGYTTRDDGTGFGLSIVRHVADAHGWDVEITNGRAGGARFEFTNVAFAYQMTRQSNHSSRTSRGDQRPERCGRGAVLTRRATDAVRMRWECEAVRTRSGAARMPRRSARLRNAVLADMKRASGGRQTAARAFSGKSWSRSRRPSPHPAGSSPRRRRSPAPRWPCGRRGWRTSRPRYRWL